MHSSAVAHPGRPDYRVLVAVGTLVATSVVIGQRVGDDTIVLLGIEIDPLAIVPRDGQQPSRQSRLGDFGGGSRSAVGGGSERASVSEGCLDALAIVDPGFEAAERVAGVELGVAEVGVDDLVRGGTDFVDPTGFADRDE